MANDIDMWNDIEDLEKSGFYDQAVALQECWHWRYNEYDEKKFNSFKDKFIKDFGYWGNWY